MPDLRFTRHGEARMQQRGYREEDVLLVMGCATCVADGEYFLTNQDVARAIAERKRQIQRLERLRGTKLVVDGSVVITLYTATPTRKRLNRKKPGRKR